MKRLLALVLALGMLCGCGAKEAETPEETVEVPEETAEEVAETEELPEEEPEPVPPADDDDFTDVLFCETEDCTVLVTGYDPDGANGPVLKVWAYNRTETELRFTVGNGVVNGIVCDPFWELTLGAGEAKEDEILWFAQAMSGSGINFLQSVEFELAVQSADGSTVCFDERVMLHLPGGEGEAVTEFTGSYLVDLAREEDYSVRVVDYDPAGSVTLKLRNNTEEQILMFSLDRVVVNGIMCDPWWAMEVPAGAEASAVVSWDPAEMAERGIASLETVAGMLYVYDSEIVDAPFLTEAPFELVFAEETEEEPDAEKEPVKGEAMTVLAADGLWQLAYAGAEKTETGGLTLELWITNNSEQVLRFDAADVTVNGAACDPYWGFTCAANARALTKIEFWPELLAGAGVTEVTEAAFRLTVAHAEDWTSDGIYDGEVRITVE